MANATVVVTSSWIPLLCLVVLSTCTAVSSAMECNGDDRAVLLRVKAQLGDPDLDITGTSISGPVPASYLAGATNLRTLVISDSRLAGPIPTSLAGLPNLRYVDLSGNFLTGAIPPGLVHGSFRFLILSRNRLTGEIPSCYGGDDVDTVDLSHNRLTGDPSPFLFGITRPATKINLSWNKLAFDMTEVRFPHHLRFLDLSHNRITGKVAKSLMDVRLEHFNVSDNELCGEIPAGRFMAAHAKSNSSRVRLDPVLRLISSKWEDNCEWQKG
uniref:Leucine-rich repeat-containing N-terminal plant-type domain-containing protein n=1 Tax=Oryza punctata TaxID=4537 RepID=A0A0E0M2T6_ORYPU